MAGYSPYDVDQLAQYQYEQMGAVQSGPRRFFSAVGRFFYRVVLLALILGAVAGVLFALYRNDVLLNIARGAGVEAQYKSLEQRIGAPGWGTPRSIDLPKDLPAAAPAAAADAQEKRPETVRAAAASDSKTSTPDGLPIVSFDSLPTAGAKASPKSEPEAISLSALPAAEPAKNARAERATRSEPAPARQRTAKAPRESKPVEVTRSIPLPKPKPEPVAKAEPAAKPEPPAPKPVPEEDRTKARASDNPLKAAIRASMAGKKPAE